MRRLWLAILFALVSVPALAQPVPADLKKVVAFVFLRTEKGLVPNGTAFWLGVPVEGSPERTATYLVTAKHVLLDGKTNRWYPEIVLRVDRKNGPPLEVPVPLVGDGTGRNAFTSPGRPEVDIAVLPIALNLDVLDVKIIPFAMATDKADIARLGITEGSLTLFVGLFSRYFGSSRNYPIVRFGHVSLLTDEPIVFKDVPEHLYLLEASSFGGNSGSPVFFSLGPESHPGVLTPSPPALWLAGVMKGTYLDLQKVLSVPTDASQIARSSMGIAAVVPAWQLREILLSEPLLSQRRALRQ